MNSKKTYDIKIIADEIDCKKALEILGKLLHTFKEGVIWKENSFQMDVKINYKSSQEK